MNIRELSIPGAYEIRPAAFRDERGSLSVAHTDSAFRAAVGYPLPAGQIHLSHSHRGVLRGVHYQDVPPGQSKIVSCASGELLDVVVDLRVGSPTFGRWESVLLTPVDGHGVFIEEGLGHAYVALKDDSCAVYVSSTEYIPSAEHEIDPLDPVLGLPWPADLDFQLSERDRAAPTLHEARDAGRLPTYAACRALRASV